LTDEQLRAEFAQKPSPVRRLRINAAPTLTAFYDAPKLMLNGADVDVLEARASRVKNDPSLCTRLVSVYVAGRQPRQSSRYLEERIYDGFPGPQDEVRMASFHEASWPEALSIVQSFDDERLRMFGLRLIYFGCRSALPEAIRFDLDQAVSSRLVDEDAGGLTLHRALRETDVLLNDGGSDAGELLNDYRTYLLSRIERVTEFRMKHFSN
jgi:exodeoxyribonuclease-1